MNDLPVVHYSKVISLVIILCLTVQTACIQGGEEIVESEEDFLGDVVDKRPEAGGEMMSVHSADGTNISFEKTGDGPPLLIVHGVACDRHLWEMTNVRSSLADYYTVYTMDRRGRANSEDRHSEEYNILKEVEDIKAVIESIEEDVILFGHSYGALCAMETALQTDNLKKLILYEPPFTTEESFPGLEKLVETIDSMLAKGENEKAVQVALETVGLQEQYVAELKITPSWDVIINASHTLPREYREIINYNYERERFKHIKTPSLLLYGSHSPQLLVESSKLIANVIIDSRMVEIDGAAHFGMFSNPESLIENILKFLEE